VVGADLPRQDLPSLSRTGRGRIEHPYLSRAPGYLPRRMSRQSSRKRDPTRLRITDQTRFVFLREKPRKCFESINFFPKHAIIIGGYAQEKDRWMKAVATPEIEIERPE